MLSSPRTGGGFGDDKQEHDAGTAHRFRTAIYALLFVAMAVPFTGAAPQRQSQYKGVPFEDSRHKTGAQRIPGRVECAYYDLGGEGIAYHDTDAKNSGSGGLNPADGTYLNEFRKNESVDTSYTKFHDEIDNSAYNLVKPPENQLYVGWTEPGEWFKLTVKVARTGNYSADLLYTSNRGGTISIDVNGKQTGEPLAIVSTYNGSDPIAWRQWHHWNLLPGIAKFKLDAGVNVLTVHILTGGNMNLAYFEFKWAQ
jgi:hypothetical protein